MSKVTSSLGWHLIRIGVCFAVLGIEPELYALALTITLSSDFDFFFSSLVFLKNNRGYSFTQQWLYSSPKSYVTVGHPEGY